MAEDHKKIDLSHLTDRERKELDEAQELVYMDRHEKRELRDISEKLESEQRGGFTEEECKKVLGRAVNLHMAAERFVQNEDSPIAPGAVLGLYYQLANDYSLMEKSDVEEEIQGKVGFHFSKVIETLADADISARIYRGNYEHGATSWDARAAEAQTRNPEVDLKKVGEVSPYNSNLN